MGNRFSSGKNAIAECDRCGQRFKLATLRKEIKKIQVYNLLVCPTCWDPNHPQLLLGLYPVDDPQAVREPRKDLSYYRSGTTVDGSFGEGSRVFQWGWNPIGGASSFDTLLTPNDLVAQGIVGIVTVVTT